jgi:VWFA-related protein
MKRLLGWPSLLFPLLLTAFPLGAQTDSSFSETVEVRVIDVDVIVTDAEGKRVTGLPREAFEILENGRKREITNFSEYRRSGGATSLEGVPAPNVEAPQKRRFLLFIDQLQMSRFKAEPFYRSLREFLRKSVRPGDEVMLTTWTGRVNTRVPFTGDVTALDRELDFLFVRSLPMAERPEIGEMGRLAELLRGDAAMAAEAGIEGFDVEDDIEFTKTTGATLIWLETKRRINALKALMSQLGAFDGKKVFIIASQNLPFDAGSPLQGKGLKNAPTGGIAAMWSTYTMLGELIAAANARDITLYTMHPPGLRNDGQPSFADHLHLMNESRSLEQIAAETGGTLAVGPQDIARQLDSVIEDLESYYSIGYKPERKEKERKITVRVKGQPEYKVRTRSMVLDSSPETVFRERVIANLFAPASSTAPPAQAYITGTRAGRRKEQRVVSLEVRIPVSSLTLLPSGKSHDGGFNIYVTAADSRGNVAPVIFRSQSLKISNGDMERARASYLTYEIDLEVTERRQVISVAVVDQVGKEARFARVVEPRQ